MEEIAIDYEKAVKPKFPMCITCPLTYPNIQDTHSVAGILQVENDQADVPKTRL